MVKTGISIGLAVAALVALPTEARADCPDPYACVCRGGPIIATGTVKTASTATTAAELTIDRIQVVSSAQGTLQAKAGDTVKITNLRQDTAVGTRIFASGDFGTSDLSVISILDGSPVACIGTTFTETEALDLSFSTGASCRDRAKERIDPSDCDDNNSCTITRAQSTNVSHVVVLGLALAGAAIAVRRRLSRR